MNYLFIITSLNQGGAEKKLLNIIKYLQKDNSNKILLVILNPNGKMQIDFLNQGIEIINLNLNKYFFFFTFSFFSNLLKIKHFKANYIISWLYHANIFSIFIKIISFNNSSLIWNIRQTLNKNYYNKINKKLLIYIHFLFSIIPDRIIFNSISSKKTHNSYLRPKNNKVFTVIPNSFDGNEFYKINQRKINKLKQRITKKNNTILISNVSRFHPMKNHEFFIKISNLLINKNPNYKFLMCGDGIKKKYGHLQNKNFIIFDNIKNMNRIHNISDCIILTSSYGESFPSIIAESMLTETLVISTDVGFSKNLISQYGLIISENTDINDINNFIELNYNNDNLLKLAREEIISNYSINKVCNIYIKTIEEI